MHPVKPIGPDMVKNPRYEQPRILKGLPIQPQAGVNGCMYWAWSPKPVMVLYEAFEEVQCEISAPTVRIDRFVNNPPGVRGVKTVFAACNDKGEDCP